MVILSDSLSCLFVIFVDMIAQSLPINAHWTTIVANSSSWLNMSTFHVFTNIGLVFGFVAAICASPDSPTAMAHLQLREVVTVQSVTEGSKRWLFKRSFKNGEKIHVYFFQIKQEIQLYHGFWWGFHLIFSSLVSNIKAFCTTRCLTWCGGQTNNAVHRKGVLGSLQMYTCLHISHISRYRQYRR